MAGLSNIEMELDPEFTSGQMIMAGFSGTRLPKKVKRALADGKLTGVILFERNFSGPNQLKNLTDSIREAAAIPPLIAADHEGGRVQRFGEPMKIRPSMREFAKKGDAAAAREMARDIGQELLASGVNLNFAPVLDVDSNPDNPVIGDRSFGMDPHRVASLGAAMIEGFGQAGLVCCAKHFPGHGDTVLDSHHELPVVEADRELLDRRELVPFAEAIHARVPMIMTAHVKVPALDPYYPATISRTILNDLLRVEMGFDGVIVTDDLEMGALSKNMPVTDAAFSAQRAGADLMLVCSNPDAAEEARQALVEGVRQGVIPDGDLILSARRILRIKEGLGTAGVSTKARR